MSKKCSKKTWQKGVFVSFDQSRYSRTVLAAVLLLGQHISTLSTNKDYSFRPFHEVALISC